MTLTRMYLSIWFGIVMTTSQSGCSVFDKSAPAPDLASMTVRRAKVVEDPGTRLPLTTAPKITNPDAPQPKVPPPGVRTRINSVSTDEPVIALTIDDGPHSQNTPKVLEMLAARNIKATFYLVGNRIREYAPIVKRMVADGHEIGNHTYTHITLTRSSDAKIRSELRQFDDALKSVAGYTAHTMRPPGGAISKRIEQWVHSEFGYPTILWSVDPFDWKKPGISVVQQRMIKGAHRGAILLCHDIHASTVAALPKVLDELLAQGYRFVTVSQLLNIEKAPAPVGAAPPPPASEVPSVLPATVPSS